MQQSLRDRSSTVERQILDLNDSISHKFDDFDDDFDDDCEDGLSTQVIGDDSKLQYTPILPPKERASQGITVSTD